MGEKTSGAGQFNIPAAPSAGVLCSAGGSANTYTGTAAQLTASTSAALFVTGIHVSMPATTAQPTYINAQLATGSAAGETTVAQLILPVPTVVTQASTTAYTTYRPIIPPIPVATATRISAKTATSVASAFGILVTLECINQSNVVDDGVAVATVTTVTNQLTAAQVATGVWTDTTAGDFTVAASIGKSVMNGVALGTGLTVNDITTKTGYSLAVTPPTSAAIATAVWQDTTANDFTTALSVGKSVMNGVALGTGLTVNDITTKSGYSLAVAPPTSTAIATAVWGDTTAGDFTIAASIGKSVMNGVALGTGLTINAYTGNTVQTGDAFARIGLAGAGLTALGDARIANLDGTVTSRLATTGYTAPDNASVTAIKAKTDSLTFTVAGQADSNIKSVKGTTVTGSGTVGSPWGP